MRRRQFLAGGTALLSVAVAGCGHPNQVLDLDEASDEDIADEGSTRVEPGSEEYRVLTSARDNGSATRTGSYELFYRTDTARVDGTYYEVSETRLESYEKTVYNVDVDLGPDNSTAERGEVAYEDLPEFDREKLAVIPNASTDDRQHNVNVDYGSAQEVGDRSALVPDPQYDIVTHEGDRYRVAVESRTESGREYRYEVTEIAPDVDSFADQVREEYLFALTGLSAGEREVVEEAIDGAYYEDDDAFRSVVEKIRAHEGLNVEDSYGTWLLSYENVEYLADVEW
ncbi:hypothetical protein BRC75_01760 [Halobacteriales archaeon QH_7_69_31]|nr:MAG: hypothetical protein BRC75_01760 [Halobacteriales archaeon QH_7_69_31]